MTYNDAVEYVGSDKMKNFHGHDGGTFENERVIIKSLSSGEYKGQWFIPPLDVLKGMLCQNKKTGALNGTFQEQYNGSGIAYWYWSSTEDSPDPSAVFTVRFEDGHDFWARKDFASFSTRVVRAVPQP